MMKQHHSQALLALAFCCLSANLLLNYAQQKEVTEAAQASMIADTPRSPKLVWLMSWPNSGTSYTLRQVERLSNFSMATNYGMDNDRSALVYPDQPDGPRCRGPSDIWPRPLPKELVLVKTHCTGYGTNSGADALKRNRSEFVRGCATTRSNTDRGVMEEGRKGAYETSLVHKAVHVVRNPFHNLVSRFNCEHKLMAERNEERALKFLEKYPKNADGFKSFCHDLDSDFEAQYKDLLPDSTRDLVRGTPCHDDIISYVQWHNHAFDTCRELRLPTFVVHYEDFEDDMNMTFSTLLDFMHLPTVGRASHFTARHDYQEYFSDEERQDIKALVKKFASNRTWNELARYFDM